MRPVVRVRIDVYPRGSREAPVVIDARNYGMRYAPDLHASGWGPHPLLEAAFREIAPPADRDIEVTIASKAPAGASTGTSAAALVALLGALDSVAGGHRTAHAMPAQRTRSRPSTSAGSAASRTSSVPRTAA